MTGDRPSGQVQAEGSRPEVSVILPTLNEAHTAPRVVRGVHSALAGLPHEILVVDDSSRDGTPGRIRALARRLRGLTILLRTGKPDLSAAVSSGFARARGRALVVMDADGQHDPADVPRLLDALRTADIAVGSRFAPGGAADGQSAPRRGLSRLAARLVRRRFRLAVRDPLSGFFALRRGVHDRVRSRLRPRGFKILLEILRVSPGVSVTEVPILFRARRAGRSKLRGSVVVAGIRQWLRGPDGRA